MLIKADTGRCVGAGQCVLSAPDIFDQDDQAVVTLLEREPGESLDLVLQAADRCPAGAISLEDGSAG
ncbi:ferredoxin [Actinophytocola xanthii]|uniref:Ferredoxin n=1 Tax=Actinophytocola xanthii TaxID=1912961 RepID=A0A1Q8BWC3_9PSEU|nr:ferredoxin [Actinophytocola xanthii]OLF06426.1 ferredoxin-1 [Actinophytocola xanthii]